MAPPTKAKKANVFVVDCSKPVRLPKTSPVPAKSILRKTPATMAGRPGRKPGD